MTPGCLGTSPADGPEPPCALASALTTGPSLQSLCFSLAKIIQALVNHILLSRIVKKPKEIAHIHS